MRHEKNSSEHASMHASKPDTSIQQTIQNMAEEGSFEDPSWAHIATVGAIDTIVSPHRDITENAKSALGQNAVDAAENVAAANIVQGALEDLSKREAAKTIPIKKTFIQKLFRTRSKEDKVTSGIKSAALSAESFSETSARNLEEDLRVVRKVLSNFTPGQTYAYDELIGNHSELSEFIKNQKPVGISWSQWMSDPKKGASDDQLLNVLQWQVDLVERMNSPEDGKDEPEEARLFAESLFEKAVLDGLLPAKVLENIRSKDDSPIVFHDLFKMAEMGALGFMNPEDSSINIADLDKEIVVLHEFSHAYVGNLRGNSVAKRWLDEAVTETIANIVANKTTAEVEVYSQNDGKSYPIERRLLKSVIDSSNGALTLDDFLEAYAGDQNTKELLYFKIDDVIKQALPGDISIDRIILMLYLDLYKTGNIDDAIEHEQNYLEKLAEALERCASINNTKKQIAV